MSGMVGALSVARAAVDEESRKAILDASKEFYQSIFQESSPQKVTLVQN